MALWCLMKSPLLIGASLQKISPPYLKILLNRELIAWNQDDAGLQGYLRASSAYPNGDTRGATLPSRAAAGLLSQLGRKSELSGPESETSDPRTKTPFRWVTYCAFGPDKATAIPSSQRFSFKPQEDSSSTTSVATVRQGHVCLTAPSGAGGGEVTMSVCNGSATQLWRTKRADVTLSPIITDTTGLCLASDGLQLLAEPCIKKPKNCSSLWNHNSANDGIDCTDDIRNRQFWYLNAGGQLISAFIKGKGTQHHPEIVFYDPDDPFCVATSPLPKPAAPDLPPRVNTSLPIQVWAGKLSKGALAVVLMNTGPNSANVSASWSQLGLAAGVTVAVRDAWAEVDRGTATQSVSALVGSHDVAALTLHPIP